MLKELASAVARNTPGLSRGYLRRKFLRDWGTGFAYWGVYHSFEAASRAMPARSRAGFDHAEYVNKYEEEILPPRVIDYPVIFWLSRILRKGTKVFDLGGSIGVTYEVCQRLLQFPEALEWQVCDVPAVVKAGEARAAERKNPHLTFTTDRRQADGCEVYITGGTLQYLEEPLAGLLRALKKTPPHLLVNKVPLTEGGTFVTLQNIGGSICPYNISNRDAFIRSLQEIGYELADYWEINRSCEIPLHPDRFVRAFHGMYFRLSGQASK